MKNNQSGLTLVEVLATLILSSIVIAVIWTALNTSVNYSTTESNKVKIQQEANYIIQKIQNEHRLRDCYNLVIDEKSIFISTCDLANPAAIVISNEYNYSPTATFKISPNEKDLKLQGLTLTDKKNDKISYQIDTIITRYKTK